MPDGTRFYCNAETGVMWHRGHSGDLTASQIGNSYQIAGVTWLPPKTKTPPTPSEQEWWAAWSAAEVELGQVDWEGNPSVTKRRR